VTSDHTGSSLEAVENIKNLEFKNRLKKYYAKNLASKILWHYSSEIYGSLPEMEENRLKFHRTITCRRVRVSDVNVHMSREHRRAFYSGLCTCSNVWTCPVCAAKIQSRRRLEVLKFFTKTYKGKAKQVLMVTFTFPHSSTDILCEMMKRHTEALEILRRFNNTNFDEFKIANGYGGLIRSLEVTRGLWNGWHPHTHELWILDYWEEDETREKEITEYILSRWRHACISVGFLDVNNKKQMDDFNENSLDIKFRAKDSDYITKQNSDEDRAWGADAEICNSDSKVGKKHGSTPFQILLSTVEKSENIQLFIEYALAMRGRAQMFWTPGLKLKYGITEKTDEQLANELDDNADILAILEDKHWRCVVKNQFDGGLLDLVEKNSFAGLQEWFADYGLILNPPPTISEEDAEFDRKERQIKAEKEIIRNEKLKAKRIAKLAEDEKKLVRKKAAYEEKLAKRAITEANIKAREEHQRGVEERKILREQKRLEKEKLASKTKKSNK